MIGYSDATTLAVIAEGMGGLDEAKAHCPPNTERYVYLRKGHQVELAYTVKFAYIDWTPDALVQP